MRNKPFLACLAVSWALSLASPALAQDKEDVKQDAAFSFADVEYYHRFTQADQHEYTPEGQQDLNAWKDMVTLNYYRNVTDAEGLATAANAVLEGYKKGGGRILKTSSVPRTKEKPAEHMIIVFFARPEFIEVAFSKFTMDDGVGRAAIYSHRVYGEKMLDEIRTWFKSKGVATEKVLKEWNEHPEIPVSK